MATFIFLGGVVHSDPAYDTRLRMQIAASLKKVFSADAVDKVSAASVQWSDSMRPLYAYHSGELRFAIQADLHFGASLVRLRCLTEYPREDASAQFTLFADYCAFTKSPGFYEDLRSRIWPAKRIRLEPLP